MIRIVFFALLLSLSQAVPAHALSGQPNGGQEEAPVPEAAMPPSSALASQAAQEASEPDRQPAPEASGVTTTVKVPSAEDGIDMPTDRAAEALGPESTYDMAAAVKRGLAVNPRIWSARYQLLGAEAAMKAARGAFGFSTNLSYGYTHYDKATKQAGLTIVPQDAFSLNMNLDQPLFTGFRLLSAYQRSKLSQNQAEEQIKNAELGLVLDIQTAFLGLLQARENVRSAQDSVTRLQGQSQTTEAFFNVGLRPRLDVFQAQTDLAQAEQTLVSAQDSVSTQVARLNTLLNLPLENPTKYMGELAQTPFSMSVSDGLATAYKKRPDLIIGELSVSIAEKDADIAKSGLYPQVSADLNYTRSGDTPAINGYGSGAQANFSSWNVGASASWKVFDFGQTYYNYESAKQNISKIESDYRNLKLEVTNTVKANHIQIQDAAKRISVARTALTSAKEGYRMAAARYQAQVGTNVDVLTAQSSLTQAEANITQALADYQTALAKFYNSIGLNTTSLLAQ